MRQEFSAKTRRTAFERAAGICECHRLVNVPGIIPGGCGAQLVLGLINFEHVICAELGGEPTLENCATLTRTCWRIKTDKYDLPTVAKTKRQHAKNVGTRVKRPWHPTLRRRLDGTVVSKES